MDEASRKWRDGMEQERVLALYDAYADGVYRVALGYLRSAKNKHLSKKVVARKMQQPLIFNVKLF